MRNKAVYLVLSILMVMTIFTACTNQTDNEATQSPAAATTATQAPTQAPEPTGLSEEKPVLKKLQGYASIDLASDPVAKKMEELTGYVVEYYTLPQENANEKLMLEIAGGTQYDFMKLSAEQFGLLNTQGALMEISDIIDAYGPNILAVVSEEGWQVVGDTDGNVYGVPYESKNGGIIHTGFGIRDDVIEELDLSLPATLDEFYDFLKTIQTAKGSSPLTGSGAYVNMIMSGFNLASDVEWYDVEGRYVPLIKMPAMVDYLAYMQTLYREGLMDNEWPINKSENINAKFASGASAVISNLFFANNLLEALQQNAPDAKIEYVTNLAKDAASAPIVFTYGGIEGVACIPKTSPNAEYVVNYWNLQSDPDTFRSAYIGEEGVSYEVRDDEYYPILPAFGDYANGHLFYGFADKDYRQELWKARARKTEAASEAFDKMNGDLIKAQVVDSIWSYAMGVEELQKYRLPLNTMVSDSIIKAIAEGTDAQAAIDAIITEWEATGGLEYETAMNEWYQQNK